MPAAKLTEGLRRQFRHHLGGQGSALLTGAQARQQQGLARESGARLVAPFNGSLVNAFPTHLATMDFDFTRDLAYVKGYGVTPALALLTLGGMSGGSRVNSRGVLEAVSAPSLDWTPTTRTARGLRLPAQSTNAWRNNYPTSSQCVVSDGTATAQDGSTAKKAVVNSGAVAFPSVGTTTQAFDVSTLVAGQTADFTFTAQFAAFGPLNYKPHLVLQAGGGGGDLFATALFNAVDGTFTAISYGTAFSVIRAPSAVLLPCGMWHVDWGVRYTQQAVIRNQVANYFQIRNEANVGSYTADGLSGVQFKLTQFERSAGFTGHIFTTSAAVTRTGATAIVPPAIFQPAYNPVEGTFVVTRTFEPGAVTAATASLMMSGMSDGTANNSVVSHFVSDLATPYLDYFANIAGVAQYDTFNAMPAVAAQQPITTVQTYAKGRGYTALLAPGAVVAVSTNDVPVCDRGILLSGRDGLVGTGDGHLQRWTYIPRAIPADWFQAAGVWPR